TQSAQAWAIVWRSLDQAAPPTEDRGEKPSLCGGVLWSSDRRPQDRSKAKASIGSASGQIGQVYRLVELGGIGRRDRWHRDAARRASVGRSSAWLVRWHTPKRRSRTAIGLAKLSPRLPLLRQGAPACCIGGTLVRTAGSTRLRIAMARRGRPPSFQDPFALLQAVTKSHVLYRAHNSGVTQAGSSRASHCSGKGKAAMYVQTARRVDDASPIHSSSLGMGSEAATLNCI